MIQKKTIKKSVLSPTILIAGGAGFIGSHIAEALLKEKARVIVLDNFQSGKKIFVEHLLKNPNFALYDVDINNGIPDQIKETDYVIHLASLEPHIARNRQADLNALVTNSIGTKNLLDFARDVEAKFMLVSSIDVYRGRISPLELENYFGETEEEESRYEMIEAKRYAEAMVWEYFREFGLDARIVRLPEIYGPRMDLEATGDLGRMLKELSQNQSLTIFGDGVEKQYYLYVEDAISGLMKALFEQKTAGNIYSLIEQEPHAVLEIAFLLRNMASQKLEIKYKEGDWKVAKEPSIPENLNLADLNWKPKNTLKEGVKKTLLSMGYTINENSFKPNKLIEEKKQSKNKAKEPETLNTLQSIKPQKAEPSKRGPNIPAFLKGGGKTLKTKGKEQTKLPGKKPEQLSKSFKRERVPSKEKKEKADITSLEKALTIIIPLVTAFFVTFIVFPLVTTYVCAKKGIQHLEKLPASFVQLQSDIAREESEKAYISFAKAQKNYRRVAWISKGEREKYKSMLSLLGSVTYFSEALNSSSKAIEPFSNFWNVINPEKEDYLTEEQFADAELELERAVVTLNLAQAEYKNVDVEKLPKTIKDSAKQYGSLLETALNSAEEVTHLVKGISDILGVEKKQEYLVLLQNSNEIRATGGFIGSYASIQLDKGKLEELEIDDIYNPDGQIEERNIQIEAPQQIKTYLEEENLFIRNANWDPDFPESAKQISDLFYQINGERFDGVIAIDLDFAKEMLKITGPIFLIAYDEEITYENLEEKAQYYSEFNYEEGSSQKKSFLSLLSGKLLEKLLNLPKEKLPKVLPVISDLLEEKHVLIYLDDTSNKIYKLIEENNWNGSLVETKNDYVYVVNSNLGGTKANYFVENEYMYEVSSLTQDGLLRAELALNYDHTGETVAWPGGPYTNYVRVITQKGTLLTKGVLIKDEEEVEIVDDIDIDVTSYDDFYVYGYGFTLQPQESVKLVFGYDLPKDLSLSSINKDYSIYWQKQPGTEDTASFIFNAPFGLRVTQATKGMDIQDKQASWEFVLDTDKKLELTLK